MNQNKLQSSLRVKPKMTETGQNVKRLPGKIEICDAIGF
jgi:hypothetical protein